MILADTSIWADHFRRKGHPLTARLEAGEVLIHPLVIGELACGNLPDRPRTLSWLHGLPVATVAADDEVLAFIEAHRLMGTGLGIVDASLLASAFLSGSRLWSSDRELDRAASRLGIHHEELK